MSGPHISVPRPYGGNANFGSTPPSRRPSEFGMPRIFKRLFKFPQMDFEMAIWEMTHLLYAPKKVFKSIYYHKQTKNTWHRPDPSFVYLQSFFLLLTSLAWSLAYSPSPGSIIKLALTFIFFHFLGCSLFYATLGYFFVGRFLVAGRRIPGLPGGSSNRTRRRQGQGLFSPAPSSAGGSSDRGGGEVLEFGYSFDVGIRAFFPVYVLLFVIQFILMPVLARENPVSTFFANSLYFAAHCYWTVIVFLGYNSLHFLHHTEILLAPLVVWFTLWLGFTISGVNLAAHAGDWLFWGVKKF